SVAATWRSRSGTMQPGRRRCSVTGHSWARWTTTAPAPKYASPTAPIPTCCSRVSSPRVWASAASRWLNRHSIRSSSPRWDRKPPPRRQRRWSVDKVWAVIRREFTSRVRSRAFVVSTILGPLLMGALFLMPILLEKRQTAPKHVVGLDAARGGCGRQVAERLRLEMRDTVTHTLPRYRVEYVETVGRVNEVRDSLVA